MATVVNQAKSMTASPGMMHSTRPTAVGMSTIRTATTTAAILRGRKNEPIETDWPLAMSNSPPYPAEAMAPLTAIWMIAPRISTAMPPR